MCINKIKVLNAKKYININSLSNAINVCDCGICEECKIKKQYELILRSKYEYLDTINKGGYVIFDTLTYSENNVPYIKDLIKKDFNKDIPNDLNFRCFCYEDVQKFFKRLRKRLTDIEIKYFLSSEYGTDERYTHRPHYHILLHIKNSKINPVDVSNLIAECWKFGRTDGIKYRGYKYFTENCLFDKLELSNVACQKYIQKYLTKDSLYSKLIRNKIQLIVRRIFYFDKNNYSSYSGKLIINSIKRKYNQFYKISKGYGISYLNYVNADEYIKNGYVIIDDYNSLKKTIQLPMYFIRKLFQYYDKDLKSWFWNEKGYELHKENDNRCYDIRYNKLYEKILSIKNYNAKIYDEIVEILGNRSIDKLAYYEYYYKDKILYDKKLLKILPTELHKLSAKPDAVVFASRREVDSLGCAMIKTNEFQQTFDYFLCENKLTDTCKDEYVGFDKILMLIEKHVECENKNKKKLYDLKDRYQRLFMNSNKR